MKLNSHVIFLIAIVGIITAGVVGATILGNGSMKQVDFDGVKVNVPSDADFVKTGEGYADSKYGITVQTFKDNNSIINYFNSKNGASMISLKNQPPQSVAFILGDKTNVVITNGAEAVAIGAKDQGLVADMANSVVFSNHQKSAKPMPVVPAIAPPPYLEFDNDFYLIFALIKNVNNPEFNKDVFINVTNNQVIADQHNIIDNGNYTQLTENQFTPNPSPDGSSPNNNQNTSLMNNSDVSNMVDSISSGDSGNAAGGNSASGDSSFGNAPAPDSSSASPSTGSSSNNNPSASSSPSSGGNSPSSGGSGASSSPQQQKLTQGEIRNFVMAKYPGATISSIDLQGDVYLVKLKDNSGTKNVRFDAYTGQEK